MSLGIVAVWWLGGVSACFALTSDGFDKDNSGAAIAGQSDVGVKSVSKAPDKERVADSIAQVEQALLNKWKEIQTISARIITHEELPRGDEMITRDGGGFYHYKKAGGKNLVRVEILNDLPPGKDKPHYNTSTKLLTICDGSFLYHVAEQFGKKRAQKRSTTEAPSILMGGPKVFEYLHEHFELSAGPEEMIDGLATYVIHCKPKVASGDARYYFDKKTGVMIRRIVEDASVKRSQVFGLVDPVVNGKIDDSKFVFEPPEGVEVIDATNPVQAEKSPKTPKSVPEK